MMKTIMTVDDSPSIRRLIGKILGRAGYTVVGAEDGKTALNSLKKARVDLIISDLNMPNMNGIELIKKVRQTATHKYVPIVMLTTDSAPELKMLGKQAGATGWIQKPFSDSQLLALAARFAPLN